MQEINVGCHRDQSPHCHTCPSAGPLHTAPLGSPRRDRGHQEDTLSTVSERPTVRTRPIKPRSRVSVTQLSAPQPGRQCPRSCPRREGAATAPESCQRTRAFPARLCVLPSSTRPRPDSGSIAQPVPSPQVPGRPSLRPQVWDPLLSTCWAWVVSSGPASCGCPRSGTAAEGLGLPKEGAR